MIPILCCGWECGLIAATGANVGQHWTQSGATIPTISTSTVRSGARSMRCQATASTSGANRVYASNAIYVVRVYVRFATLPSADCSIVFGNAFGGIRFKQSDSKLYVHDVTTGFGATGVSVTTGVWYLIDFLANGSAGQFTGKVDGADLGTVATFFTAGTACPLGFNGDTCTADMFFDDFVVSHTLADYPIGAGYVNHFVPTADGTHNIAGINDFERTLTGTDILNATTDAFDLVNDVPLLATMTEWINMVAPPNATDYVECIFGPAPGISAPTVAPRAVEVICGINQAGTGAGNMEIRLNDNGTEDVIYTATGVAGVTVATGQQFKRKHYAAGPAGPWTIGGGGNGDFTDLRIRFGSPAELDVNPDQYFGSAMIEAEFAEVPPAAFMPKRAPNIQQAINRSATW